MVHFNLACPPDTALLQKKKDTFVFTFHAGPSLKFCFAPPSSPLDISTRPFKRRRALSDVDGKNGDVRKKRRLRLHLITSRLSLPFSQPASNIALANHGSGVGKVAIWGPRKRGHGHGCGKNVLRKAAIMNRVRLRMLALKEVVRRESEERKAREREEREKTERLSLREIMLEKPRYYEPHPPPSPLGLSNYDALDLEDEYHNPYSSLYNEDDDHEDYNPSHRNYEDDDDEEEEQEGELRREARTSIIYSDFNIMNPITSSRDGEDEYEFLDALDGISHSDGHDEPPTPPTDERVVEMLKEEEESGRGVGRGRGASFFVRVGA